MNRVHINFCKYISRVCKPKYKIEDLTGKVFGYLTVIKRVGKSRFYGCRCICGGSIIVNNSALINGMTKSCCANIKNNNLKFLSKSISK